MFSALKKDLDAGNTPTTTITTFVEHGGDLGGADAKGYTIAHYAAYRGRHDVIDAVVKATQRQNNALYILDSTAFLDEQAGQCGYCLSGILISAKALLDRNPNPSRREIAAALDDNLCRCGSHVRILTAVERAAKIVQAGGESGADR